MAPEESACLLLSPPSADLAGGVSRTGAEGLRLEPPSRSSESDSSVPRVTRFFSFPSESLSLNEKLTGPLAYALSVGPSWGTPSLLSSEGKGESDPDPLESSMVLSPL